MSAVIQSVTEKRPLSEDNDSRRVVRRVDSRPSANLMSFQEASEHVRNMSDSNYAHLTLTDRKKHWRRDPFTNDWSSNQTQKSIKTEYHNLVASRQIKQDR
jgi:hypothetical protein